MGLSGGSRPSSGSSPDATPFHFNPEELMAIEPMKEARQRFVDQVQGEAEAICSELQQTIRRLKDFADGAVGFKAYSTIATNLWMDIRDRRNELLNQKGLSDGKALPNEGS